MPGIGPFTKVLLRFYARQAGKVTEMVRDYPSWVAAEILPLWALTMAEAMESPSP